MRNAVAQGIVIPVLSSTTWFNYRSVSLSPLSFFLSLLSFSYLFFYSSFFYICEFPSPPSISPASPVCLSFKLTKPAQLMNYLMNPHIVGCRHCWHTSILLYRYYLHLDVIAWKERWIALIISWPLSAM